MTGAQASPLANVAEKRRQTFQFQSTLELNEKFERFANAMQAGTPSAPVQYRIHVNLVGRQLRLNKTAQPF
jgi:hypothetical protein